MMGMSSAAAAKSFFSTFSALVNRPLAVALGVLSAMISEIRLVFECSGQEGDPN